MNSASQWVLKGLLKLHTSDKKQSNALDPDIIFVQQISSATPLCEKNPTYIPKITSLELQKVI